MADCDGLFHGYNYRLFLDCGVGELQLMHYADYSGRTNTATTGGVWPSWQPCLPVLSS